MSARRPLLVLLGVLALTVGVLSWAVVGQSNEKCPWAMTAATHMRGYLELPCGSGPRSSPSDAVGAARATPSATAPVTRDDAIKNVAGSPEVPSGAMLTAKLVTLGDFRKTPAALMVATLRDDQLIWVVSVAGGYFPESGNGTKFAWGLVFTDSQDGQPIGEIGGNGGGQAPYFDSLTDLDTGAAERARSTGHVAGTIREVGGPSPGLNRAIAGTVAIVDARGKARHVRTSSTGSFWIELPIGSYRVSAQSPDIEGGHYACSGTTRVAVASKRTTRVDVICDIK